MKLISTIKMIGWLLLGLVSAIVHAQDKEPTLQVGSSAPQLQASKWLGGEPVEKFEKGKIYVIDFWATWCGPCIEAMPHLSALNTKFKDKGVVVIGMNVDEVKTQAKVEGLLKKMGSKVNFLVALDTYAIAGGGKKKSELGKMWVSWMDPAGQDGIPTTFVVDKEGKIAWIGHPLEGLDDVVAQLIADKFDARAVAERDKKAGELQERIDEALEKKEWDKAFGLMDELVVITPQLRTEIFAEKAGILLTEKKDYAAGYAAAEKLLEMDDVDALNELTCDILSSKEIKQRNYDVALKLAKRADELAKHDDPYILDTLALAHFKKGDVKQAIEIQKLAIAKLESMMEDLDRDAQQEKKRMNKQLKKFQNAPIQRNNDKTREITGKELR